MVTLPRAIFDAMLAHVRADYPDEACGILQGDGQTPTATDHFPARNAARELGDDPATFSVIAGTDLLAILNQIDAADGALLAYYHSHPRTAAYPSERDIQYAGNWPGLFYLIFSLIDPQQPVLRAFLVADGQVSEAPVQIAE